MMEVRDGCSRASAGGSDDVDRSGRRAGRRWRGGRTGSRFWGAIARGLTTEDAARRGGRVSPRRYRWFRHGGGMNPCLPPTVPAATCRSPSARRSRSCTPRAPGCARSPAGSAARPSTISRELRRNAATRSLTGSSTGHDRPVARRAPRQAAEGRQARRQRALRDYVQERLAGADRRPDGTAVRAPRSEWNGRRQAASQATGAGRRRGVRSRSRNRLRVDFPDDESMRITHEAIYQALYVQGRGALKRELVACLRTGRALRVPRARTAAEPGQHVTPEVMISERPGRGRRIVPSPATGKAI